ncbi:unnamed protein product [Prunus armeniaca]|uniref:Uncharacterized protein n=1 Tax=Prunus armeniaca TaxID=36596 RepID=A0A6J5VJN7_PRUAR|nr:unnamed protein product [Prunus armeniaca]CAB4319621.1 unnamed protein product [Prunus armeniaca]
MNNNDTAPTTTSPLLSESRYLFFSQSLSDFDFFHMRSSFCDDIDEIGSTASYPFLNSSLISV